MAREEFDFILENAVQAAKNDSIVGEISYPDLNGNVRYMKQDKFMDELSEALLSNGVDGMGSDGRQEPTASQYASNSLTFALHAINNINTAGKIKAHIDTFFDNEQAQKFINPYLEEKGVTTEEQKEALRKELKEHVDEKLAVKASSPAAKSLIGQLQKSYDENYKGLEDTNAFLKEGLAFVYSASSEVNASRAKSGSDVVYAMAGAGERCQDIGVGKVAETLTNELSVADEIADLSNENPIKSENFRDLNVMYGTAPNVKLSEFLEHAKTGEFTNDEKLWANSVYNDIKTNSFGYFSSVEYKDVMMNGKPMFSEDDLKKNQDELSCRIVENMLKGEDVAVKKSSDSEITHLTPKLEEVNKSKNIFQTLIDLIKNIFSKSKEIEQKKVADIRNEIAQKQPENKANRQRMNFSELIGENDLKKVAAPSGKTREKTLGREM